MKIEERKRLFLIGLEKLTRETGLYVCGCGCCDSPSLEECEPKELDEKAGYALFENPAWQGEFIWLYPDHELWDIEGGKIVK
jgi:hypothetical protein